MAKKKQKAKAGDIKTSLDIKTGDIKPEVQAPVISPAVKTCEDCGGALANARWRVCPACLEKRQAARLAARKAKTA